MLLQAFSSPVLVPKLLEMYYPCCTNCSCLVSFQTSTLYHTYHLYLSPSHSQATCISLRNLVSFLFIATMLCQTLHLSNLMSGIKWLCLQAYPRLCQVAAPIRCQQHNSTHWLAFNSISRNFWLSLMYKTASHHTVIKSQDACRAAPLGQICYIQVTRSEDLNSNSVQDKSLVFIQTQPCTDKNIDVNSLQLACHNGHKTTNVDIL